MISNGFCWSTYSLNLYMTTLFQLYAITQNDSNVYIQAKAHLQY